MSPDRLVDRRWRRVIPLVFVTYSLAYLDRVNYGFAAAAGMAKDLGITETASSLLGALFFFAYFLFQIPGTIYAEKRSVRKLVFWCLLAWGGLAALTGLVTHLVALLVIRFLLGVAEAAVLPALFVLLSHWFSRAERSKANTFLILGNPLTVVWMSVVSGYLVKAFSWRWMFILEGIPAVIWAFVWWNLIDDYPASARWLDKSACDRVERTLLAEQQTIKVSVNYREAFRSPLVICLCAQYFCWSLGIYGFVLWLPSILKTASHFGMVETGWLSSLPYLLAAPSMMIASYWSDRCLNRNAFIWPFLLLGGMAFYGSFASGPDHFWICYSLLILAGICMYVPYGPFFAILPEALSRNVAGGATALVNGMGALGGFAGSYLVGYLRAATASPASSYILMSAALLVSAGLALLIPRLDPSARESRRSSLRAQRPLLDPT